MKDDNWVFHPYIQQFSWFSGCLHNRLWFFCPGDKNFGYFPEVPVTRIGVSAPAPYKNPPVIKKEVKRRFWRQNILLTYCQDSQAALLSTCLWVTLIFVFLGASRGSSGFRGFMSRRLCAKVAHACASTEAL